MKYITLPVTGYQLWKTYFRGMFFIPCSRKLVSSESLYTDMNSEII